MIDAQHSIMNDVQQSFTQLHSIINNVQPIYTVKFSIELFAQLHSVIYICIYFFFSGTQ